jgi:hypothetical protein
LDVQGTSFNDRGKAAESVCGENDERQDLSFQSNLDLDLDLDLEVVGGLLSWA